MNDEVSAQQKWLTLPETPQLPAIARTGYLEGHYMADAFNLLRENDLIW